MSMARSLRDERTELSSLKRESGVVRTEARKRLRWWRRGMSLGGRDEGSITGVALTWFVIQNHPSARDQGRQHRKTPRISLSRIRTGSNLTKMVRSLASHPTT